jgi:hypothetical protein
MRVCIGRRPARHSLPHQSVELGVAAADPLAGLSLEFRRARLLCSDQIGLREAVEPPELLVHALRETQAGRPRKGPTRLT